jgi:molybdate transport system substrate-binding protein
MKRAGTLLVLLVLFSASAFCENTRILVSAAASLADVLTELHPAAEAFTGATILYNFGGSGSLRKQIEEGAPVDVFFSAAALDMDLLQEKGLLLRATRKDVLSNAIVLVGGGDSRPAAGAEDLRSLLAKADLLAIGNPDAVPAGRYAVQALTALGLYPLVQGKLVLGGTVREVLQYVQSGSAPLGIVFATDALAVKTGGSLRELFRFPTSALAAPVVYPVAAISASRNRAAAEQMVAFLAGDTARAVFQKAGFIVK